MLAKLLTIFVAFNILLLHRKVMVLLYVGIECSSGIRKSPDPKRESSSKKQDRDMDEKNAGNECKKIEPAGGETTGKIAAGHKKRHNR